MKKLIVSAAILALSASVAHADDAPAGPTIEGAIDINVESTGTINAAVGNEAIANQEALGVKSGTISGGIEMTGAINEDINAAVGNKATATQEMMSIDSGTITGDVAILGTVDEDINAAVGNDSTATQKIGVIGQ